MGSFVRQCMSIRGDGHVKVWTKVMIGCFIECTGRSRIVRQDGLFNGSGWDWGLPSFCIQLLIWYAPGVMKT